MNAGTFQQPQSGAAPSATAGEPQPPQQQHLDLTDLGNAQRLVRQHGPNIRYCLQQGGWLVWDGRRWAIDQTEAIMRLAKDTVKSIKAEARAERNEERQKALFSHAKASQSAPALRFMLELARSEGDVVALSDQFDADPMLLNVSNGTIDLHSGQLRPHRREDLLTMLAPVEFDPAAAAPLFMGVVANLAGGDDEMFRFLGRAVGYAATGATTEQVAFFFHGDGHEGKTLFLEAVGATLGDYGQLVPSQTLLAQQDGGIPNDVARLRGKRFARASEIEQGKALAEAKIKQLTGGDTMVARYLRQEFFEFRPVCKLFLASNHLPRIKGTDRGIWRRIVLIRCPLAIREEDKDRNMPAKLNLERSGILAWIVRGCLEWQRQGLAQPASVVGAVTQYRTEMDVIGQFFDEHCSPSASATVMRKDVYSRYVSWCLANGERALSSSELGEALRARGYNTKKSTGGCYRWLGFELKPATTTVSLCDL